MRIEFRNSFTKDLKKIRDPKTLNRVKAIILEIESTKRLDEISVQDKKAEIHVYQGFYLISL